MVVSAVTTFDGKALTKGGKQISAFEKGVKGLGKTLGLTFGAAAIIKFGKASVKAYADNEKSAKRLANVVKNLGQAFETPFIEQNLDKISAQYGYQGEVLREAYQKLIGATGSAAKSNELLTLSLDVAAGSTVDLLTVNQDLAAAYLGNTRGLAKYNLGLSKTQLKTLKFEDAVALLTKNFKGAAGNELTTYEGKMRVLGEAAGNAQEIIGKGLVDSLTILAGESGSIQPVTDAMTALATETSNVIVGLADIASGLSNLGGLGGTVLPSGATLSEALTPNLNMIPLIGPALEAARLRGKKINTPGMGGYPSSALGPGYIDPNEAKRKKVEADRLKAEKARAAAAAKTAQAEKQKISLSKAAAVFDSTRISLTAALQSTYDKETKLRLEALKLIEEEKGDEALKKIGELAAFQKNADMQRLAGVTEISNATLESLNKQLITEIRVINDSKMAEGDKELAREEAFKKYNAAITAAGTLAAKESYNERVQIQLTEIARLASISKTTSAANTANLLLESSELSMIDRVAKAQKAADDQRLAALKEYSNALSGVGAGGGGRNDSAASRDMGPLGGLAAGVIAGVNPGFTPMPTLTDTAPTYGYNPTQGFPGQSVEVTINTGIGDPEAIARAVEDLLNQSTYRGTSVNRGAGNYVL
jgi:hypothetical protein